MDDQGPQEEINSEKKKPYLDTRFSKWLIQNPIKWTLQLGLMSGSALLAYKLCTSVICGGVAYLGSLSKDPDFSDHPRYKQRFTKMHHSSPAFEAWRYNTSENIDFTDSVMMACVLKPMAKKAQSFFKKPSPRTDPTKLVP